MSIPSSHSPLAAPGWTVRQRRWLIIGMLLSLHLALTSSDMEGFSRVWFLIHFGLFLIWQPFVSGERELNVATIVVLLVAIVAILATLAGWMLTAWIALLIAAMGGKVFTLQAAQQSRFYLVAVFYLFAILLSWTVPVSLLSNVQLLPGVRPAVVLGLPIVLGVMALLPFHALDETKTQVFDFFYSLFVFQLVVVLVLGSVAAMRVTDNQYFPAVALTVLAFAGALLLLAAIWGPRAGFGGLRTYFSRYLMSVGMPFESWMQRIAEHSDTQSSPERFLDNAMHEVAQMPWIVGATWRASGTAGRFGRTSIHTAQFRHHALEVTFHTGIRLSPALFLHVRLLAQVIGEFYEGKRREQAMKENAYMQAVHETGARLTHDIKNLLQSLYALTSASLVERERHTRVDPERRAPSPFLSMLDRQLPQLTKRLQATLDKLRNPEVATADPPVSAALWWQEVTQRHADSGIGFHATGDLGVPIPGNLFDVALENCLDNARKKREREPALTIDVALAISAGADAANIALSIGDDGSPIPSTAAETLFHAPTSYTRGGGLGIGLFQVARQARQSGYAFTLAENRAGHVRFELRSASSSGSPGE